jgi:cysteine-rich secretory family protein
MPVRLLPFFAEDIVGRQNTCKRSVSAESVDVCAARLFTIALLVAVVLSANLLVVHAQTRSASGQQGVPAERVLFDAANRERAAQGLAPLRWDDALANAAREHALLMEQRNTLSHQFAGEAALQDRARFAGARFTEIAENVAEGPSADAIHTGWMNSPHHRANLLDPGLTAIGIAVVVASPRGTGNVGAGYGNGGAGMLFAVQDFSQSVAILSLVEQERQVAGALAARGLQVANFGGGVTNSGLNGMQSIANRSSGEVTANTSNPMVSSTRGSQAVELSSNGSLGTGASAIGTTQDARRTCEMDRGWAGGRPALVVRYESADLSRLPGELEQKIQSGRYRAAVVGACGAPANSGGFTRFRVAVLLF